jgi:hypothetical protein
MRAFHPTPLRSDNGRASRDAPSIPSIGRPSIVYRDRKFLSEGANGPEHQALRRFMETSPRMATILIAYDIRPPRGGAYDDLVNAIQSLGPWWHHLETIWIVQCAHTPREIRDRLKSRIGNEDQLLVIDISGDAAGWVGVNESGRTWLEANI